MISKPVVLAFSLSLLFASVAYADHDEHHEIPTPVITPALPQAPPPPPPPPAPPPVFNFSLPIIAPNTTILPTDANMPFLHPSSETIKQLEQKQYTKEELTELSKADPRYAFTGEWHPFSSNYASELPDANPFKPVGYETPASLHHGQVEHLDNSKVTFTEATFMPTRDAEFSKIHDKHLDLGNGAVLVRAGKDPVVISSNVRGHKVKTQISGGAIMMISAFDGKTTLLHLTDKSSGSIVSTLPTDRPDFKTIALAPGQVAEVYDVKDRPTSNLVSTKVHVNERLSEERALLISQCNYVRALKKFNLVPVMQKTDKDRILKTAAAISYIKH
jgi:hypothetical protein